MKTSKLTKLIEIFITHLFAQAKKNYFEQLTFHQPNSKKSWELINSAIKRPGKNKHVSSYLNIDGNIILKPTTEVAEKFNTFFVNIETEIESKIPPAIPNEVPIPLTEPES